MKIQLKKVDLLSILFYSQFNKYEQKFSNQLILWFSTSKTRLQRFNETSFLFPIIDFFLNKDTNEDIIALF